MNLFKIIYYVAKVIKTGLEIVDKFPGINLSSQVNDLENYCDLLNKLSNAMNTINNASSSNDIANQINNILNQFSEPKGGTPFDEEEFIDFINNIPKK